MTNIKKIPFADFCKNGCKPKYLCLFIENCSTFQKALFCNPYSILRAKVSFVSYKQYSKEWCVGLSFTYI